MDSFNFFDVDLTTAHTDLEITVKRPVKYLQFVADGTLSGISVKVGTQSDVSIPLDEIQILPVTQNPEKLYLTNDLRAGRSTLRIYFARGEKLELYLGGQPISAAEQAVRLGSISRFDRRGEIIFQDDFEGQSLWSASFTGYGSAVLSTAASRSGSRSMKLTTGAIDGDDTTLQRRIAYPATPTIGLEVSHRPVATAIFDTALYVYTGSTLYLFALRYDSETSKLQYVSNTTGTWVDLATSFDLNVNLFHTLKYVVNIGTGEYIRAIIDNASYDMTGKSTAGAANATTAQLLMSLAEVTGEAAAKTAYCDDVIVTKNEPV